eukprot:768523-Hanusia_phi.AAC.14
MAAHVDHHLLALLAPSCPREPRHLCRRHQHVNAEGVAVEPDGGRSSSSSCQLAALQPVALVAVVLGDQADSDPTAHIPPASSCPPSPERLP